MSHHANSGWREMRRDVIEVRKADYLAGLYGANVLADISLISGAKDAGGRHLVDDGLQSAVAGEELMDLWEKDEVVEVEVGGVKEKRRNVTPTGSNLSADQCDADGLWWKSCRLFFNRGHL